MRHLPDGSFRFSPQDLIAYLEGDFAAWCERNQGEHSQGAGRGTVSGSEFVRDVADEETELVMRRGLAHEAAHLELLRAREPGLVEIKQGDGAHDATRSAMRDGAPVLFPTTTQAWFVDVGVFDYDAVVFRDLWTGQGRDVFDGYLRYYLSDHRPMWVELRGK